MFQSLGPTLSLCVVSFALLIFVSLCVGLGPGSSELGASFALASDCFGGGLGGLACRLNPRGCLVFQTLSAMHLSAATILSGRLKTAEGFLFKFLRSVLPNTE